MMQTMNLKPTFSKIALPLVVGAFCPLLSEAQDEPITGPVETPFGKFQLEKGLPAGATESDRLYDELDFQRACQAYIWALPIVSFAEWQHEHETVFGAKDGDLVVYTTYRDKLGILTANATTPYIVTFVNLAHTGPLVVVSPPGAIAGGMGDFWQRPLTDIGQTGPDQGKGGKYLVVGPGQETPKADGYYVVHSPTINVMAGFRALDVDPTKAKAIVSKIQIHPYRQRTNPSLTRLISAEGKSYSQVQPRGLEYWERLHAILQEEPVEERDRMFMAMLAPLGIEKGKPFTPDARQKKILTEGAQVGQLMAINNSFSKRFKDARYRSDTNWVYVIEFDPGQEEEFYSQLDQRAAYFYEAVTSSKGMVTRIPGIGQAYLGAYKDKTGQWFDGAKKYKLHVPADPPAKQFWSLTLYDTETRCLIDNSRGVADKSSRMPDLLKNADGSVDLYMSPEAPAGQEQNWIPTVPGKYWFAYFRLYAPLESYLSASWPLPDIELVP
jgi:hypothetical protein